MAAALQRVSTDFAEKALRTISDSLPQGKLVKEQTIAKTKEVAPSPKEPDDGSQELAEAMEKVERDEHNSELR